VRDVLVIEGRQNLGFALKSRQTIGVSRDIGGQDLDRDLSLQLGIARAIHLAHPACSE
jgi:hypothetical protein